MLLSVEPSGRSKDGQPLGSTEPELTRGGGEPAGSQQVRESAWGVSVPLFRYETSWSVFTEEGPTPGSFLLVRLAVSQAPLVVLSLAHVSGPLDKCCLASTSVGSTWYHR